MPSTRFGRRIRYRALTIRESPFVYPVQPEVPEAIDLILAIIHGTSKHVLELGSGTGIIACALAADGHSVVCTDIHPGAVRLTRKNASANGLQLQAIESDLFDQVAGSFDLIVFNVPNTIAVTDRGTLLQYLGARLLPKRWLEATANIIALRFARNLPKKQSLLAGILTGAGVHLRPNGRLMLLAQSADLPYLLADDRFVCCDVIPLRNAEHVQLVIMIVRCPAPKIPPCIAPTP